MLYAVLAAVGVGVIGLLYGLLERSKRQAADSKADALSKSVLDQIDQAIVERDRAARIIAAKDNEILALNRTVDALTKTSGDVARRLNDLLSSGVRPREAGGGNQGGAVPDVSSSGSDRG